jgi:serine phosphatase RsbU (regulator of sigma subunit)
MYTDAFTEAHGCDDTMLKEEGLLRIVSDISTNHVREFGGGLLQGIREFRRNCPAEDDVTLLVLKFVTGRQRTPGIREKLNAYAKLLGLKST